MHPLVACLLSSYLEGRPRKPFPQQLVTCSPSPFSFLLLSIHVTIGNKYFSKRMLLSIPSDPRCNIILWLTFHPNTYHDRSKHTQKWENTQNHEHTQICRHGWALSIVKVHCVCTTCSPIPHCGILQPLLFPAQSARISSPLAAKTAIFQVQSSHNGHESVSRRQT